MTYMPDRYHSSFCYHNQVLTALTTSSFYSNFLLRTAPFRGLKRWNYTGARLGLLGGCSNSIHPNCVMVSPVLTLVWGPVLSRLSNILHRFLSGQHTVNASFLLVVTYASELIFVPLCITSRRITPSESQNSHHHVSSWWRTQSSCIFPSSPSVTLFAQWSTVLLLTAALP